jgi:putative hydrolase of the HAD superfamily
MISERVLVLDFGGVVTRTLFETHDLSEKALGLPAGSLTWRGPFDPDTDALWVSMQAGEVTERDYWSRRTREVGALVGEPWTDMQSFVTAARGADPVSVIRPEFVAAIDLALVQGVRLAILSNELDLFYGADFRNRLPFLSDFDLIVDASHTGILKPDPAAYALVTDGLGVAARNCIFVDDQKRNIDGAQAFGMQTVHFDVTNPQASYDRALKLLGLHHQEAEQSCTIPIS